MRHSILLQTMDRLAKSLDEVLREALHWRRQAVERERLVTRGPDAIRGVPAERREVIHAAMIQSAKGAREIERVYSEHAIRVMRHRQATWFVFPGHVATVVEVQGRDQLMISPAIEAREIRLDAGPDARAALGAARETAEGEDAA